MVASNHSVQNSTQNCVLGLWHWSALTGIVKPSCTLRGVGDLFLLLLQQRPSKQVVVVAAVLNIIEVVRDTMEVMTWAVNILVLVVGANSMVEVTRASSMLVLLVKPSNMLASHGQLAIVPILVPVPMLDITRLILQLGSRRPTRIFPTRQSSHSWKPSCRL